MSAAYERIDRWKREAIWTELEVGKIVQHPEHGRVTIVDGRFWDDGRLSNWWTWRKVDDEDRPIGKTYRGYGWLTRTKWDGEEERPMGRTWEIVCDGCKVRLWVAQDMSGASRDTRYVYGGNFVVPRGTDTHSPLAEFLFGHEGHPLRFLGDSIDDDQAAEYQVLDSDPGLPPAKPE